MASTADCEGKSSKVDKLSFVKYMKNIGRAYRKQAMELVSVCRLFVQVQKQTPASDSMLRSVLDVVDDALKSAAEEGTKTSERVDEKFEAAIKVLDEYHVDYHPERSASKLSERMAEARKNDRSSSTILNRLKEKFRPIVPEPTTIVEFLLHKTLLDSCPTIVKQVLGQSSDLKEILWNFSRFKDEERRLTLKKNPHFYPRLPTFPEAYGSKFRTDPISENFQHTKISVLTDNPPPAGRVYLETAQSTRAFGNVCVLKAAIIFKDVCGKLEGESIVGEAIKDPSNLLYFEEPSQSPTSQPTVSPNQNSAPPFTTVTPTSPTAGVPIQGWKEATRRMSPTLKRGPNVGVNIRISTKPPGNPGRSYSVPSSPIPHPLSSSSEGSILPIALSQSLPPTLKLHIPEPVVGPPTPNYRTARTTPLSQRSPVAGLSPGKPEPPYPGREPSILPTQPVQTDALPSPVASILLPRQQPTVTAALPVIEQVTPVNPTACPLSDTSRDGETQRDAFSEATPSSSLAPIAEVPLSGSIAIVSREVRRIPGSRAEGNEGGMDRQLPSQVADFSLGPVGTNSLASAPAALPSQVQEPAVVPEPRPQNQKKNWFQKHIWDYRK